MKISLIHFVTERRLIIIRFTFRIFNLSGGMRLGHRDYQHGFFWKYGLRFVVVLLNNKARYSAAFSGFCFLRGTIRQHWVWFVVVFLIFLRLSTRKDRTGLIVVLLFRVFSRGEVVVLVGGGGDDP